MRELFPYTFGHVPTWFYKTHYAVFLRWLDIEVDPQAELRLPILREIHGHHNREVYQFVKASFAERWDYEITMKLYGTTEMRNDGYLFPRVYRPLIPPHLHVVPRLKSTPTGPKIPAA